MFEQLGAWYDMTDHYAINIMSRYQGAVQKEATMFRVSSHDMTNAIGGGLGLFLGFSVSGTLNTIFDWINNRLNRVHIDHTRNCD